MIMNQDKNSTKKFYDSSFNHTFLKLQEEKNRQNCMYFFFNFSLANDPSLCSSFLVQLVLFL